MKSIFISSTFRDMQAERDILHQQVFPALRKRLSAYGEDIQELDLRWGVDTSRMSEEKSGEFVVESCIDSIERCKPYMVVLLGSRYGWIPEQKTIDATADDRIRRWYETGSSITQLEIQYGALRAGVEPDRCVFCFRNEDFPDSVPEASRAVYAAESPAHAGKLQQLKSQIRSRKGVRILNYHADWDWERQTPGGLEAFAQVLTEQLWQIVSADLDLNAKADSPEARIFQDARLTGRQYLGSYVSRKLDRESGAQALCGRSAFWFSGEPGSGKSAMMAKIADNGIRVGAKVFLYYGGNAGCRSANALARTLIWWLNDILGTSHAPSDDLSVNKLTIDSLLFMQRRWHADLDYAILVDGVDQMEEDAREFLCWLSRTLIPENQDEKKRNWHGLAVSSTEDYWQKWSKELEDYFSIRKLEPLNNSELDSIAQSHSARRGKKLDENVMRRIRAKEKSRNPYYLSLLLQKLFMMNQSDFEQAEALAPGMAGLSAFMCREVETVPDTVEEMTLSLLEETCEKLSARMRDYGESCENMADPMEVLALLAASREGLTLEQLSRALALRGLAFPTMFLERLFAYLYDSFSESAKGIWDFKHRLLRESLIQRMGRERYCQNCNVLLSLSEADGDTGAAFYYAWQTGDVQRGLRILRCHWQHSDGASELLGPLQQSESGSEFLAGLAFGGDSAIVSELLSSLLINIDSALRYPQRTAAILQAAAPKEDSTPLHWFRHCVLQQKLRFWDYDTAAFSRGWKQVLALYAAAEGVEDTGSTMQRLCREVLCQKRYWDLWGDAKAFLDRYQPKKYFAKITELDRTMAGLLVQVKAGADGADRLLEARTLTAIRDFLLEQKDNAHVLRGYRILAAELAGEKKCHSDVVKLLKDMLRDAENYYSFTHKAEDALHLIRAAVCIADSLQAQSAVTYYRKAQTCCRQAMKDYPGTCLQYLSCRAQIGLWQAMEKTGDREEAYRCLDQLIPELDQLVEAVGENNMPVDVLQEFLDQRYRRVYRRRTKVYHADESSGKMSMDDFVQMLQGGKQKTALPQPRVNPWKYTHEQEADFYYMNNSYPPLEKRCRTYSVYIDMAYAKMEEIRFYDACHREDKMIAACNRMLTMASFMADTRRANMVWYSLGFRLELAELLFRWYYGKSAADLAEKTLEMMQNLDTKWVVENKRVDEYNRRTVRCYLLLAQAKMRDKEQLQEAFAKTFQAVNKLAGKDDIPAMDKSCDDLRCESWLLMGRVLKKMGRDYADIMSRADKFWPEEEICNALEQGGHDRLVRLLNYCECLSLRARDTNDAKLLERAVNAMCRIAMEHTENGDASLWEQLYEALKDACRYYWNHSDVASEPGILMECMIRAIRLKAERAELKREEQILLAHYGLQVQDQEAVAGKALPDEGCLKLLLEHTMALDRQVGRGTLRARLAMSRILRGDYEGALDITGKLSDVKAMDEIRLLILMSGVAAGLWNDAPGKEPWLPKAKDWLQTPAAAREPVIARYLEAACAVMDSRYDGAVGITAALHGLKLLKPLMESLDKNLRATALPDWAARLCEKLMHARSNGWIDDGQYLEVLKTGSDALSELYHREERDEILSRCIRVTAEVARVYHTQGEYQRAMAVGLGALRQELQLRKTPTMESRMKALEIYRLLRCWQEEQGISDTHALELISKGGDLLQSLFEQTGNPALVELLLKETENFRRILPQTKNRGESWVRDKIFESYSVDREACMYILERGQREQWQKRYLQAVQAQLRDIPEGHQQTLEDILGDLWEMEPQNREIRDELLDLTDQITGILRSMPDDMMYLMMQAVRELDSDAALTTVEAYINKRRQQMPMTGL